MEGSADRWGWRSICRARKEGLRELSALRASGQDPALPVLSEIEPKLNHLTQVPLGLIQIAIDQIDGTVTKGRTSAFSRSFLPLLEPNSEFASKWSTLYDAIIEDGLRQPWWRLNTTTASILKRATSA